MPFIDNRITRLSPGFNQLDVGDIFNSLPIPDSSRYHFLYDDFVAFAAADWSVGGVGTPTRAIAAGNFGIVNLGTSAADNDNSWLQQAQVTFALAAGKKLFFRARAQVSNATQSDVALGLQIAVAGNNFLTPANGIFFRKNDDATSLEFVSRAGGVETSSGVIASLADATAFEVSFYYDGSLDLWAAVNGTAVARITPAALPGVSLGVVAGLQNGDAVVRTLSVDQLYALIER